MRVASRQPASRMRFLPKQKAHLCQGALGIRLGLGVRSETKGSSPKCPCEPPSFDPLAECPGASRRKQPVGARFDSSGQVSGPLTSAERTWGSLGLPCCRKGSTRLSPRLRSIATGSHRVMMRTESPFSRGYAQRPQEQQSPPQHHHSSSKLKNRKFSHDNHS